MGRIQTTLQSQQVNLDLNKLENKVLQLKNILECEERPISARILKDMLTEKETLHSNPPANRVGETGLFPVSTSHTTVRTVRYTAVP